jgi:hypothetical protein
MLYGSYNSCSGLRMVFLGARAGFHDQQQLDGDSRKLFHAHLRRSLARYCRPALCAEQVRVAAADQHAHVICVVSSCEAGLSDNSHVDYRYWDTSCGRVVAAREAAPLVRAIALIAASPPGLFFIGCGFLIYALHKLNRVADRRSLAEVVLSVFALLLAVRILAQVVPCGYSIFYDGPLRRVFIITLRRCMAAAVPELAVERRRGVFNSLLAVEVLLLAVCLIPGESRRTARFETSWGTIYLEPAEARVARKILGFIEEQKAHSQRVVVLPEGHAMYAFSGTEAPSRWGALTPGILSPRQEEDYIADLRRARPSYIILTNRRTGEYGPARFGIDYSQEIYRRIDARYFIASQFGDCSRNDGLRAILYRRRTSGVSPSGAVRP